jgi:hypothetical protein
LIKDDEEFKNHFENFQKQTIQFEKFDEIPIENKSKVLIEKDGFSGL